MWIRTLAIILVTVSSLSIPLDAVAEICDVEQLRTTDVPWIVFGSFRGGDFSSSIHAIHPDGSDECRLSPYPSGRPGCLDPFVSPDGKTIAFVADVDGVSQVWTMNAAGGDRKPVTSGPSHAFPSWSPGGDRIVCSGATEDSVDLFVIDREGTVREQLTSTKDRNERHPSWSPDGRFIAFTAKPPDAPDGWQSSVYVLDLETGPEASQVTSSRYNDTRPTWLVRR